MSDTEKMNEAMYERLGEIVFKAVNTRMICNSASGADEKNVQLLAAFKELRQMVEFYKPEEKEPVVPGCPSLMPRQLPGGFDGVDPSSPTGADTKAAKTAEYMRRKYSFCDGLFPIRLANCEKAVTEHCWIGGRRFTMELTQDIHDDGEHVCCAKIRDNGNRIARLVVYRGKSMAECMAHAAFQAYVKQLSGGGAKYHNRRGFLRQNAARARAKQQAHDNKAAAENGGQA